jgi:2-oxoglutarate ferredoxin oxidoreductase subunit alpha
MSTATEKEHQPTGVQRQEIRQATVRFAGDSGDGMQLAGTQFTNTSAVFGNDVSTLPDYPAEIRAPAGTLPGVSGFQIQFSSEPIRTPGDRVDALIAMNPAALKVNRPDLVEGGILIVNVDEFTETNLKRVGFAKNPLKSGELKNYRLYEVPITRHTMEAVKPVGLGTKEAARCKNFYALGLLFWLYERPLETTERWIDRKFARLPDVAEANKLALRAGYNFGDTAEMFPIRYSVQPATLPPGTYRNMTGNQALAIGLITAARLAQKPLFYGSYPITPASDILHELASRKNFDVRTFQAEDEIAAMSAVIGAAYAGALAATGSSGPGIALKQEAIGLAVTAELPCVVIDVQRAGPSTGMPTKPEQSDLWQAMLGRNGECPAPVIAACSPSDCFRTAIEAARVAMKYMTPVLLLSDGFLANSSEPWRIPRVEDLPPIKVEHPEPRENGEAFLPYERNEHGGRPWALPGTLGLQHRIGGLEKQHVTGNVNYEPDNHQLMVNLRARKVAGVADNIPDEVLFGDPSGELLVISWGGTFGAVRTAVDRAQTEGGAVSHLHLRWLNPLARNVGDLLRRFNRVLVCEMNMGQLQLVLRGRFAIDADGLHKVQGRPFAVQEVVQAIQTRLGSEK